MTNHHNTRDREGWRVPNTVLRCAVYMVMILGSAPTIYWGMGGSNHNHLERVDSVVLIGHNKTLSDAMDLPRKRF
jgi:hypothetical protein